jgi:hypothetical protein
MGCSKIKTPTLSSKKSREHEGEIPIHTHAHDTHICWQTYSKRPKLEIRKNVLKAVRENKTHHIWKNKGNSRLLARTHKVMCLKYQNRNPLRTENFILIDNTFQK